MTCPCRIGSDHEGQYIQYCPLHAAAPTLLEALKAAREAVLDSIANKTSMNNMKYDSVGHQVLDAIAKAEGQ